MNQRKDEWWRQRGDPCQGSTSGWISRSAGKFPGEPSGAAKKRAPLPRSRESGWTSVAMTAVYWRLEGGEGGMIERERGREGGCSIRERAGSGFIHLHPPVSTCFTHTCAQKNRGKNTKGPTKCEYLRLKKPGFIKFDHDLEKLFSLEFDPKEKSF